MLNLCVVSLSWSRLGQHGFCGGFPRIARPARNTIVVNSKCEMCRVRLTKILRRDSYADSTCVTELLHDEKLNDY